MRRALILGGTGMLGRAVVEHWRRRGGAALALSRAQADVNDRERLLAWAEHFRPEIVVNCAALTRVDDCEREREEAMATNGAALSNVTAAAERAAADLFHVSTDYVFDGRGQRPYDEQAPTAPLSVYGKSKLAGERLALRYPRTLVVRSSWLFGPGGPNFVKTMRRLADSGKPLRVVGDQIGCPTYALFLARAIWDLAGTGCYGVIHYRNRDAVSWYDFAREILGPDTEIESVTSGEFPRPAPRPAYSVLDVGRFEQVVGRRVEPWIHGLAHYLETSGDL